MNDTEMTYSREEANYLLKNLEIPKGERTLFDWILILFKADQDSPLVGIKRVINETFLMYNEIISEYQTLNVLFVQDDSGVSSEEVENAIDDLLFVNYLEVTDGENADQSEKLRIGGRGINYISKRYNELPLTIQERLQRNRKQWDSLNMPSLIKLVQEQYKNKYSSFLKIHNSEIWKNKGDYYLFGSREYDKAIMYFDKALKINPNDGVIWKHIGQALQALGKNEEAISSFDEAIKLINKPTDLALAWLYRTGSVASIKGVENDEVINSINNAIRIAKQEAEFHPDDKEAWRTLGYISHYLGLYDNAIEHYDRLLKIDPKDENAKELREEAFKKKREKDEQTRSYG